MLKPYNTLYKTFFILLIFGLWGCRQKPKKKAKTADSPAYSIKTIRQTAYEALEVSGKIRKGEALQKTPHYWGEKKGAMNNFKKEYNREGMLQTSERRVNGNRIKYNWKTDYDKQGRKWRETKFKTDGSLVWKTEYQYRGDKKTGFVRFDAQGDTVFTKHFRYNSQNQKTEIEKYTRSGKLLTKTNFDRYPDGRIFRTYQFNADGELINNTQYRYNQKKQLVGKDNKFFKANLYVETRFQYSLDREGNWVKAVVYRGKQPKYVLIREITYY